MLYTYQAHLDRQTKALLFNDTVPRYAFGFVHVEDCARIHIEALDEGKVKDEDLPKWYVAAGTVKEGMTGPEIWRGVCDTLEREFKQEVESGVFRLTGESMRSLEECVREVAEWYLALLRKEAEGDG
jgi:nucleoside-diphosphate-sugar epimerase